MCKKDAFSCELSQFTALKLTFWCKDSSNFVTFCRIGSTNSKTMRGNTDSAIQFETCVSPVEDLL